MTGPYDDIINLPHYISKTRPQMSLHDRAAQFASFAALSGYDTAVKETARLTDTRLELDEYEKSALNDNLSLIADSLSVEPVVAVTYFLPDKKKAGGAYITSTGIVKKIDEYERVVIMLDGAKIPIEDIYKIESDLFRDIM